MTFQYPLKDVVCLTYSTLIITVYYSGKSHTPSSLLSRNTKPVSIRLVSVKAQRQLVLEIMAQTNEEDFFIINF